MTVRRLHVVVEASNVENWPFRDVIEDAMSVELTVRRLLDAVEASSVEILRVEN